LRISGAETYDGVGAAAEQADADILSDLEIGNRGAA